MNKPKAGFFIEEPFRIFFPLGILMGTLGIGYWHEVAAGRMPVTSTFFHSSIQIEAYMNCFVIGFLLTAIPRFSASFPTTRGEVLGFLLLTLAIPVFLWMKHWILAELCFIGTLAGLARFALVRFKNRNPDVKPPVEFVWIPVAILHGILGSLLLIAGQAKIAPPWVLYVGKPMAEQGFMLALVLGVGGFLAPRLTGRFEAVQPPEDTASRTAWRQRRLILHLMFGALFFSSFWLEVSPAGKIFAYWIRAALATAVFLWNRILPFPPRVPDLFVRLLWVSFWMVALGSWAAAVFPQYRTVFLHLVWLGGFSLMTFAVGTMVVLSHGGEAHLLRSPLFILYWVAFNMALALGFRILAAFFPAQYFLLLGFASGFWMLAGLSWFGYILPKIFRVPNAEEFEECHEEAKERMLKIAKAKDSGTQLKCNCVPESGAKALILAAGIFWICMTPSSHAQDAAAQKPALTESLFKAGEKTYERQCSVCHGARGTGDGPAAYLLYPKPRDFTRGEFRLVSTSAMQPTDQDLFRTITRGMPGSSMPPWESLSRESRWGLVYVVRYLAGLADAKKRGGITNEILAAGLSWDVQKKLATAAEPAPDTAIKIPAEPARNPESLARGRKLFVTACAPCHGLHGRGDGPMKMQDSAGFPLRPRDLTAGIFKGDSTSEALYYRVTAGIPGSPMPSYQAALNQEQIWDLIHYIQTLSAPEIQADVRLRRVQLRAQKTAEKLSGDPEADYWQKAESAFVPLTPLWWRDDRIRKIKVKALHDGTILEIYLEWADSTRDDTAAAQQLFSDGAAVELSAQEDPPFFGMGSADEPVAIWHWKASWQEGMEKGADLETRYPNAAVDWYPAQKNYVHGAPFELKDSKTGFHDPKFMTAWGAGNPMANPERESAAEEARAGGLGTLTAAKPAMEKVDARGVWGDGKWRVVFRRVLKPSDTDRVELVPGKKAGAAFALWDGAKQDRDGQKVVSIWNDLDLEP